MTGEAQFDYDLFVIGAGSGGVRAARAAACGWTAEATFCWPTLIANKDREIARLVGAHMVGPDATVALHPTAAEEFVTLREKRNADSEN